MCINPSHIWVERGPKWEKQPVACRQCWRCRNNRVNDYVARCLCEAATSAATCALTLTYAPRDDLADKVLDPSHFQLFMKRLRRAGHKVRYLVVGEYGDLRARTHFHCLLFFTHLAECEGPAPSYNWGHLQDPETSRPLSGQIPNMTNCHVKEWPHGHVFADWAADERAIRYICKYLLKDGQKDHWFSLSKKPALGHEWFQRKAALARDLEVLPSTFEYLPPGGDRSRPYLMTGATRRDYLNAITTDAAKRDRMSEWVQKTFDKYERQRVMDYLESLPAEVIDRAFTDHREMRAEQGRLAERFRRWREDVMIDRLLQASPTGRLYREDGQWKPERTKRNGP